VALSEKDISRRFSWKRVLIPVLIGLGVATWLLISHLNQVTFEAVSDGSGPYIWMPSGADSVVNLSDTTAFVLRETAELAPGTPTYVRGTAADALGNINWTWYTTFWLLMALLTVAVRDLGYMYRLRVLTDQQLSWRQCFDVIMLWEFASALTPSVVGGSGVAMFIINREGVSLGKSTAVVMVTAMLDELFYILMVPVVLITVGTANLFVWQGDSSLFGWQLNTEGIFWVGYGFIVLLTVVIVTGIFLFPQATKRCLSLVFRLRLLRRWQEKAMNTGDEIITTSRELKGKPLKFWLQSFGATFFAWTARFWIVNFMIMAFVSYDFSENLLIYARQLAMWVIMLISPTPGGAGIAEVAFSGFLADFMPVGVPVILMAILWRLFSYYPYLFIGIFVLPRWLRRTARDKQKRAEQSQESESLTT